MLVSDGILVSHICYERWQMEVELDNQRN